MSKLKLNKRTLSALDKNQLEGVKGGEVEREKEFISLWSCKRTRRNCCSTSGCLTC